MALLYSEAKSDQEIIDFVKNHVKIIRNNKDSRYHVNLSLIPEGGKYILDYGCGWGLNSIAMRDKGNRIEAIDLQQNEIDICMMVWGKQEKINFECKKITAFADKTFDVVLSTQVIEHVHNAGNYLYEINRVLKQDGILVISLPNTINPRFILPLFSKRFNENLRKISTETLQNYDKTNHHINAWDPTHFVRLLASVGFQLEKHIPSEGIPFPMKKPFKHYVTGWISKLKRLRNFSYTMHFRFKKVKDVIINAND